MKSTYGDAMAQVFVHEGGYGNHPSDPGGPTNFGITINDARMYWKPTAAADDVRNMPKSVASDIYDKHYAAPMRYNDLPAGVDYTVLDYGINSGIGRSGKVLRRVCSLSDTDWHVTDEVIAAVNKRNPLDLINAINDERLRFLKSLKTWPVFGQGWERRVREVRTLSLNMARKAPVIVQNNDPVQGKGSVPTPKAIQKSIVVAGGAGSAGAIAWAYQHPGLAVAAAFGSVIVIGGVLYLVHRHHQSQQHAATPGLVPVPAAA